MGIGILYQKFRSGKRGDCEAPAAGRPRRAKNSRLELSAVFRFPSFAAVSNRLGVD
jgi:hypothetical protein